MSRLFPFWLVLVVLGCQPYLDHETGVFEFSSELHIGPKRQLALLDVRGQQEDLLLIFNQPLRSAHSKEQSAPFVPEIHPPVEIAEARMEGTAGVRVRFSHPLARASEYRISIPVGWRAQSGAGLLRPIERRWKTPLPELSRVGVRGREDIGHRLELFPGQELELDFNQPVAPGSVEAALEWSAVEPQTGKVSWTLSTVQGKDGTVDRQRFLFKPHGLQKNVSYRLALGPGIKGLEGPLRSVQAREFLVDCQVPLRYLGPDRLPRASEVTLVFSAPVDPSELARCLLSVPERARPSEIAPHPADPARVRLQFPESERPSRLVLLPGMKSRAGHALAAPVEVELPRQETPLEGLPLLPIPLPRSTDRLEGGSGVTETWPLQLQQALQASLCPDDLWQGKAALPWEKGRPAFRGSAISTTRAWAVRDRKTPATPFLAVRRTTPQGTRSRGLLSTGNLDLLAVSTSQGVRVKVRRRDTGAPWADCALTLRGVRDGLLSPVVKSDKAGEALLPVRPGIRWPEPVFVVGRSGAEVAFQPVGLTPTDGPKLPAGFVMTDQVHYPPGQPVLARGFLWSPGHIAKSGPVPVSVVTPDGRQVCAGSGTLEPNGFLKAECLAPEPPGTYSLRVELPGAKGSAPERALLLSREFRVCPVATEGEVYSVELEDSKDIVTARLLRGGARHRQAGLRAYRFPPEQPLGPRGWTLLSGRVPAWTELGANASGELRFPLHDRALGGTVVVEAFDQGARGLVLARSKVELDRVGPSLNLESGPRELGAGRFELNPTISGPTGSLDPRFSMTLLRLESGGWKELQSHQDLGGPGQEPWELTISRPGNYRLRLRALLAQGEELESIWEREFSALDLADPEFRIEPEVAMPGAVLQPALPPASQGREYWVSLSEEPEQGRFCRVGPEGALPAWTFEFARALTVLARAEALKPPRWGDQRCQFERHVTAIPLGPLSRQSTVKVDLARRDGLVAPPKVGQDLRLTLERNGPGGGWVGTLLCLQTLATDQGRTSVEQELLDSFLGRSAVEPQLPEAYPLLPESVWPSWAADGLPLTEGAEVNMAAPERAGEFQWLCLARDSLGRFAWGQARASLEPVSSWEAFTPWGVRAGDRFEAGVEFASAPSESGVLGLTATALQAPGLLTPTGYLSTSGVVKPGASQRLAFDYACAPGVGKDVRLAWSMGRGGKLQRQEAEVAIFETPWAITAEPTASVTAGTIRRLNLGRVPSRLTLRPPRGVGEEAVLKLSASSGSMGRVTLRAGASPVILPCGGLDQITLEHQGGGAVSYELAKLEPDIGSAQPWGGELYLFRELLDTDGVALESARTGKSCKIRLDLVAPRMLPRARVRVPLPGGLRPLGLSATLDGVPLPSWRAESGEVRFELDEMPAGEYLWELEVQPVTAGDYLWPAAVAVSEGGDVFARTGSSRLVIQD